LIKLQF